METAGKLVTLKGTIVRASSMKPLVRRLDFLCPKCGCEFTEELLDGFLRIPSTCQGDGCRGKYFLPQKSSAVTVDWQKIRLQVQGTPPSIDFSVFSCLTSIHKDLVPDLKIAVN